MKNWFAYTLVVFATFFWGSTFFLVKLTVSLIPVNFFLMLRFGFASLILTPIIFYGGKLPDTSIWKQGIILGLLNFSSYYFQTIGLQYTAPANAAFITGLNVVFIPIFAYFIFDTHIKHETIIATLLALVGIILITLNFSTFQFNPGDLIILLTAISIAFHILFTERYISERIIELLWTQFITMTISATILNIFESEPKIIWYTNETVVFTLILTVLFATVFAFAAQMYAQQVNVPSSVIGILFTLEMVFALLIDFLIGIIPSVQTLSGMVCVFVAIVIVTLRSGALENIDEKDVLNTIDII